MTQTLPRRGRSSGQIPSGGPRLPDILGPIETAIKAWRALRRMSTALLLLFAMAAASVVATVVPQAPVTAVTAEQWRAGTAGPGKPVARVLDALGMFDIFGAWWFMALVVLLFVSLTGCLIPRYRAFAKVARRPPAAGRNFGRLSNSVTFTTDRPPSEAIDAAQRVLRKRRYRTRLIEGDGPVQVAAERGHWREGGSLVFHTAFYLLLAGAVIGKLFGFTGQIGLAEGAAFADTRIAYDFAEPGREWDLEDHRGFVVTLDDFDVQYFPDFTPKDFVSTVTISEGGVPVTTEQIRVNHPLRYKGMVLFQMAFGMAPRVVVRAGDEVLVDERVRLAPNNAQNIWTGTAKVKVDDPQQQIALELVLAPDARMGSDGQPTIGPDPRPRNPVLVGNLYFGELGLQRPVPADQFMRGEGPVDTAMLRPGDAKELAKGSLTVEFADLGYWSGLQVSHAPGRWVLALSGVLVLLGLVPSLYSYRRRVWVEVDGDDGGARVTVAGVALQRKAAFEDEIHGVANVLSQTLQATPFPRAESARS